MKKYKKIEYDYKEFKGSCINSIDTHESLNKLGEKGWQICSTMKISGSWHSDGPRFCAFFMREVKE